MDEERREWIVRVLTATQQALDDLRNDNPLYHRALIEDLEAFRDRVRAELEEGTSAHDG